MSEEEGKKMNNKFSWLCHSDDSGLERCHDYPAPYEFYQRKDQIATIYGRLGN